jgi:hypothetical protein
MKILKILMRMVIGMDINNDIGLIIYGIEVNGKIIIQ